MNRLQQVSEVADLVSEFGLTEVHLKVDSFSVTLRRRLRPVSISVRRDDHQVEADTEDDAEPVAKGPVAPSGIPVSSPMTGIYYGSPSPSAPAFVKEGEAVTAGQVVGLIEAMKVFNEIVSPVSGTVTKVVAQSGNIVQPGDPLLYVG